MKVEYGKEKFVKFYVEADVVDGIVLNYSFSSLVEDIRRTCGSLRHHTSSALRVRYKDKWRFCESKRGRHIIFKRCLFVLVQWMKGFIGK